MAAVTATVPDKVKEWLDNEALEQGRSVSSLIAFLLEQAIEQRSKRAPHA